MSGAWGSEWPFIIFALLVGGLLSTVFHQWTLGLWLCLLVYLLRHLFHINRLLEWLREGRPSELPRGSGLWEEVYYLIHRLQRRNKRRKKQLLRILEQFRTATAALPDATVVLGSQDQIDWFNHAAERLLGLRRNDVGHTISGLLRYPRFTHYLKHGDYTTTVDIPSPVSNHLQLEIRIVPYGEDLRLLIAHDVTQLHFMERVRSDFVANVSHELRTPLTVLKGYLETIAENNELPVSYTKIFQRMEEQTVRMQNLIDGLLSLTRLESSLQPVWQQTVDVPILLSLIIEELKVLYEKRPFLQLILESHAHVLGSEQELRSAFSNLIANAIKYCPTEGQIVILWRDEAEGARLDIQDTGPGIAPEHIPRLTERFYRVETEKGKSGFGLGLAIVKHVLARHSAELHIVSIVQQGSCFSACFPAKQVVRKIPCI